MKIVLASRNANKIKEIAPLLPKSIELLSLTDIDYHEDIPEDHDNLEDNSLQKAMTIWKEFGLNSMAEDTGLFVDSLQGEPGVYSARYAGPQKNDEDNIQKILNKLEGQSNRAAHFKTVFTVIIDGHAHQFEGVLDGHITLKKQGDKGFGYDPIFSHIKGKTLAEVSLAEKSQISHRAIALQKVIQFLEKELD